MYNHEPPGTDVVSTLHTRRAEKVKEMKAALFENYHRSGNFAYELMQKLDVLPRPKLDEIIDYVKSQQQLAPWQKDVFIQAVTALEEVRKQTEQVTAQAEQDINAFSNHEGNKDLQIGRAIFVAITKVEPLGEICLFHDPLLTTVVVEDPHDFAVLISQNPNPSEEEVEKCQRSMAFFIEGQDFNFADQTIHAPLVVCDSSPISSLKIAIRHEKMHFINKQVLRALRTEPSNRVASEESKVDLQKVDLVEREIQKLLDGQLSDLKSIGSLLENYYEFRLVSVRDEINARFFETESLDKIDLFDIEEYDSLKIIYDNLPPSVTGEEVEVLKRLQISYAAAVKKAIGAVNNQIEELKKCGEKVALQYKPILAAIMQSNPIGAWDHEFKRVFPHEAIEVWELATSLIFRLVDRTEADRLRKNVEKIVEEQPIYLWKEAIQASLGDLLEVYTQLFKHDYTGTEFNDVDWGLHEEVDTYAKALWSKYTSSFFELGSDQKAQFELKQQTLSDKQWVAFKTSHEEMLKAARQKHV